MLRAGSTHDGHCKLLLDITCQKNMPYADRLLSDLAGILNVQGDPIVKSISLLRCIYLFGMKLP